MTAFCTLWMTSANGVALKHTVGKSEGPLLQIGVVNHLKPDIRLNNVQNSVPA
jgi:hypothetical protein